MIFNTYDLSGGIWAVSRIGAPTPTTPSCVTTSIYCQMNSGKAAWEMVSQSDSLAPSCPEPLGEQVIVVNQIEKLLNSIHAQDNLSLTMRRVVWKKSSFPTYDLVTSYWM